MNKTIAAVGLAAATAAAGAYIASRPHCTAVPFQVCHQIRQGFTTRVVCHTEYREVCK